MSGKNDKSIMYLLLGGAALIGAAIAYHLYNAEPESDLMVKIAELGDV